MLALMLAGGLAAVAWAVLRVQLPPADFTFVNETEIKSLDPHNVTGEPEHRILQSHFRGADAAGRRRRSSRCPAWPSRGMSRTIRRSTRFICGRTLVWSNGEPVTAHDFVYSGRRFLDPMTAAEYAYQAWYIKNARRYSLGADGHRAGRCRSRWS